MTHTEQDLYTDFYKLVQAGDESSAREFLTEHFADIPSDMQEEMLFASFKDAVNAQAEAVRSIASIQKKGLNALKELVKTKKDLQTESKILDIKKTIGAE